MNKIFFILLLYVGTTICVHSQDYKLITPAKQNRIATNSVNFPAKLKSYKTIEFVEIDASKIAQQENFQVEYNGKIVSMKRNNITFRGVNDYYFVGNADGYNLFLSIIDNDIQGVLETPEKSFSIETMGENVYALVEFDPSKMVEGCENLDSNNIDEHFDSNQSSQYTPTYLSLQDECKIRVLVLYTTKAKSAVSNIKNTVLTAVELANTSFANSNIQREFELVYIGETNYNESNYSTDLKKFKTKNDGAMDEVHTLRTLYSADVCVLLSYEEALCGIAAGIGVESNDAFCLVSVVGSCATSNYSFGHEIGHLLGCRHDIAVDDTKKPFSYGHGYIAPSKKWRTIMAYGDACNYCPRKNYWSNPDILFDNEPMGTTSLQNNTRVWNEQSPKVVNFSKCNDNETLNKNGLPNTQYANIVAKKRLFYREILGFPMVIR